MLAVKSNQEFRDPKGLLQPPGDSTESGFKRVSSFKQKKPDHVRLDVTLVRRNSLPSPVSPKMFLAPPEDRPLERVRSFHLSRGGVRNRGDLIRRRSTLSVNSCEKYDTGLKQWSATRTTRRHVLSKWSGWLWWGAMRSEFIHWKTSSLLQRNFTCTIIEVFFGHCYDSRCQA